MPVRVPVRLSPAFLLFFVLNLATASSAFAEILRGRVLDPQDRVVAGADVLVMFKGTVVATATTRADGTFGPIDVVNGQYDVLASAPSLRGQHLRLKIDAGKASDVTIKMALSALKESVVVSAAQVDTALSRATDDVTVFNRADIERHQAVNVVDLLRFVPGFGVVQTGGAGGLASLFPRGGESDYTLVLVDGIPQNAFGGGFNAAHLGTSDVERVEVVRGAQSALFGGGAIGSVVEVVTRRGGPMHFTGSIEGGAYGTMHGGGSLKGSARAWRWGAGFDSVKSAGDTRVRANLGGPVSNDDYKRATGSGSLEWSDRSDRSIRFDFRAEQNERGAPGPFGSDPAGNFFGLDAVDRGTNNNQQIGLTAMFGGTSRFRHHFQLTWLGAKSTFGDPAVPDFISHDNSHRTTFRYQSDFALGASLPLSAGVEFLKERNDNTFITGAQFQPVPVERSLTGFFVEARPVLGDRGFMTLGARIERIQRGALEEDPGSFNLRPAFGSDVVWSVNPKVSVAWWLHGAGTDMWTKLRGSAGTGIKPPTGFEIAFTNNPNLKPERSRSFDIGVEQALAGSRIVANLTWFHNTYDDLIVSVGASFTGASTYRTDNVSNARSRGLEAGARFQIGAGVTVHAAWTFLDTELLAVDKVPGAVPTPYAVGDPLIRRPRQQGSLDVMWTHKRAGAYLSIFGRGEILDLEPNFGAFGGKFTAPGYRTTTIGGSFRFTRGLELFGRVTNLLDRSYEEALGYPALGRAASVGIRIAAGK